MTTRIRKLTIVSLRFPRGHTLHAHIIARYSCILAAKTETLNIPVTYVIHIRKKAADTTERQIYISRNDTVISRVLRTYRLNDKKPNVEFQLFRFWEYFFIIISENNVCLKKQKKNKSSNFSIVICSFRTTRQKKKKKKTEIEPSIKVFTCVRGSLIRANGARYKEQTHSPKRTLHFHLVLIKNHHVWGCLCTHDSRIPWETRMHSHRCETGCSSLIRLAPEWISTANRITIFSQAST